MKVAKPHDKQQAEWKKEGVKDSVQKRVGYIEKVI